MSALRLTRGQRLLGKIGAAAVVATLTGVPGELVHWVAGDLDASSMALAGKPPKPPQTPPPPPPPPPPTVPQAQPLNVDPNTIWFADWHENSALTVPPNFFATPPNSLGVPFMQTQMNGSAASGRPLGIKVLKSLTLSEGAALFNTKYQPSNRAISYVFADFEEGTQDQIVARISTTVAQVRMSQWSKNAYVGQWDLTPLDPQDEKYRRAEFGGPGSKKGGGPPDGIPPGPPDGVPPGPPDRDGDDGGGNVGSQIHGWGRKDYDRMKVNMANTSLYPGATEMRNTSTGDWQNKNIRTGLFIAPIGRMTQVQNVLDNNYNGLKTETDVKNHKQIPWVARFNNFGNQSLDNGNLPGLDYVFVPGQPLGSLSGEDTANQMLGRGDTSAMIRHYRMRGAYSVNLFESGVVGYSQQDFQSDVRQGWSGDARLNSIMAQGDNKYATMTLNPTVDGSSSDTSAEKTGTIWSGQYSLQAPNANSKSGKGDMMLLASNLDTVNHLIKFGDGDTPYDIYLRKNAQGYTWEDNSNAAANSRNALIEAGMHKMMQFDLVETRVYDKFADVGSNKKSTYHTKTIWLWNNEYHVFGNNDRNQMGIPEPTTFGSLAAAGAIAVVCRRQRRKA